MTLREFFGYGSKLKRSKKEIKLPDNFIIGSTEDNGSRIGNPDKTDPTV